MKTIEDKSALGFLSVKGLLHDLTRDGIAIIEGATFETYNDAFANVGYSFESLRVRDAVETPKNSLKQGCQLSPPDDDSFGAKGNVLLFDIKVGGGVVNQGCRSALPP